MEKKIKSLQEEIEKEAERRYANFYKDQRDTTADYHRAIFIAGAKFAISQFQRQEAEGWVKVEDELPPNRKYILIYRKNYISMVYYSLTHAICTVDYYLTEGTTHWRDLPSPPETK